MFNFIFNSIKKVIRSLLFIYAYNSFFIGFNVIIPINILTVVFVCLFDIYGVIGIVILSFLI